MILPSPQQHFHIQIGVTGDSAVMLQNMRKRKPCSGVFNALKAYGTVTVHFEVQILNNTSLNIFSNFVPNNELQSIRKK